MMLDITMSLAAKFVALALIPVAFGFAWTAVQLFRGDKLAFKQARAYHPTLIDALLGRTVSRPSSRHGAPVNDGLVLKRQDGKPYWYLNSRMSDEQYDRLTK
jgi:hypothetical protein